MAGSLYRLVKVDHSFDRGRDMDDQEPMVDGWPLWSGLPKKRWVGLTDEDKRTVCEMTERDDRGSVMAIVEAMLKDKNA